MKLGFTNGQQFKAKVRALAKEKQIDPRFSCRKSFWTRLWIAFHVRRIEII